MNIGIIGLGYWGPNYLRIVRELEHCKVSYCCDLDEKALERAKLVAPEIKITKDFRKVAEDPETDAVIITTPLNTHYEIGKFCLEHGKHVLMEKPCASNSDEARALAKISEKNDLVLMAGHVYEYHPAVRKLKEEIKAGKLGDVYYMSAERVGLGPIRKYASALWDLATHDISIALYLFEKMPREVSAQSESYIQKKVPDVVFLTMKFPGDILCNIHASWIAPEKIRKVTLVGSKGMAVFDDVNKSEMLKIYEREIDKSRLNSTPKYIDHQRIVKIGNVYMPPVEQSEPLRIQCEHFIECILKNRRPATDAMDGLKVIKILEAAEKSIRKRREGKFR
ncbi:MAG: Gfo/Idh/MocA family oxidoreductase [Candidatus Hadarchaeales archaeon]